jgi:plasmid stability protein
MNWITTNLRLPEDLYMELKMKAARERKSIAAVVREKLSGEKTLTDEKAKRLLQKMNSLREKIAKEHKELNLTKAVIDARYE